MRPVGKVNRGGPRFILSMQRITLARVEVKGVGFARSRGPICIPLALSLDSPG